MMLRPCGRRNPYIGAASCFLLGSAIGIAGGWALGAWRSGDALAADVGNFTRRAAVAHAVYSPEVRHPVEVWADEKSHLTAWLSKRMRAEIRAPDLTGAGFALLGGRLLPGEGAVAGAPLPAAQFMFENPAGRRVTLYIGTAGSLGRKTEPRYARERGVAVLHWAHSGLAYAITSIDMTRAELGRLAQLARSRPGSMASP